MTKRAARLVDETVPPVPVRQWVVTLPYRLRYLLARDHGLSRVLRAIHAHTPVQFYRKHRERHGNPDGGAGASTPIQRFGAALNLNVHFHTLALEGVFAPPPVGPLADDRFRRLADWLARAALLLRSLMATKISRRADIQPCNDTKGIPGEDDDAFVDIGLPVLDYGNRGIVCAIERGSAC